MIVRIDPRQPVGQGRMMNADMSSILNKSVVLVLNRNWQAINVRTPQEAFCMMATNVATGLQIEGEDQIRPVLLGQLRLGQQTGQRG
jgi:hypothetical protein